MPAPAWVAIARAVINDPDLILADEPTGALDSETGRQVITELLRLGERGRAVVLATHDREVAAQCDRILYLEDGVLRGLAVDG